MDLDDAYENAAYIEGGAAYPQRWLDAARAFASLQSANGLARLGLPYGAGDRHRFDLFYPDGAVQGLLIFVHGGYWLKFDRSSWSHLATGALQHGWAVAMPSYDLCPDVRIPDITRQIAAAIGVIAAMVPGPLSLAGHSAGGHLTARMLAPGMLDPDVAGRLHHVVPISPICDLAPLLETSMNTDLGLTPEIAHAESPLYQPVPNAPVSVWVGENERPAFLDQARILAQAWACDLVIRPGKHHFDVIDDLADPQSDLIRRLTT